MALDPMLVYRSKPQGGKYKRGRMQRVWMQSVEVGDVLKNPRGSLRVVRKVTRYDNGDLRCITFAKKKCSWTGRPGAVYGFCDLRIGGWMPTGACVALGSEADFLLEVELATYPSPPQFSCCEARDMP